MTDPDKTKVACYIIDHHTCLHVKHITTHYNTESSYDIQRCYRTIVFPYDLSVTSNEIVRIIEMAISDG